MDRIELQPTDLLKKLGQFAWDAGYPLAQWRLPGSQSTFLLISESIQKRKIDLEEVGSGFAFSPFENPQGKDTLFFPADNLYEQLPDHFTIHQQLPEDHPFWAKKPFQSTLVDDRRRDQPISDRPDYFIQLVEKAVQSIQQGSMKKIVLSRTMTLDDMEDFQPQEAFQKLAEAYPDAFVAWVYLPESAEMWLCATPETLVSQDDVEGIFTTMSLAGTQSGYRTDGSVVDEIDALWSQKEIEEQALVGRYIIDCFKKVRIREYEEIGPRTYRAGNLLHLKSDFTVRYQEIHFPQITTVMLDLLHPTSAVCGMPKEPATQFIRKEETHDRSFYAGYLGPVHIQEKTHLFVHLRTLRWKNNQITLFAGCGVTSDSIPIKEWEETTMKCRTLGSILFQDKLV